MSSANAVAPVRFAREHYFSSADEKSLAQFLSLFQRYGYIYKPLSGGSWCSADEKWRLSDSEILKAIACVHSRFLLGCRAGKTSRFAVLDIDAESKYHCKTELDRLLSVLASAGLTQSSLYRSSFSEGWHLYLFFDEPINSAELRRQLVRLLKLHDFDIARGTLEIFPCRSDASLGMGLRLPLQPGFAWLSKYDLEIDCDRSQIDPGKALELFVDALESDANTCKAFQQLKEYIRCIETRTAKPAAHPGGNAVSNIVPLRRINCDTPKGQFNDFVAAVFGQLPSGIIPDNWYKGRHFHLQGLSGPSQRAEAIICIGHYLFYGDPSRQLPPRGYGFEQERQLALHDFLSRHHNNYSKDINDGRPDALAQIERATHWCPEYRKGAGPTRQPTVCPLSWSQENSMRMQDARQRIQTALEKLLQLQRAFTTVELQEEARCSRTTLYKHQDLWRAAYDDRKRDLEKQSTDCFSSCTHVYNVGVIAPVPSLPAYSGPSGFSRFLICPCRLGCVAGVGAGSGVRPDCVVLAGRFLPEVHKDFQLVRPP